jgi:hypothetical protein
MTVLPTDLEVERSLASVRIAVLEATRTVRSPRRSTRYRTTRTVLIAAAVIVALTGGAIVVAQVTQELRERSVTCFDGPTLQARQLTVQGVGDEAGGPIDPLEACAIIWRDDSWSGVDLTDQTPGDGTATVPDLVACELPDGSAAVLPRDGAAVEDFCEALGLADWGSD